MRTTPCLAVLLLAGAGCNRQDVEGLERIGRKVVTRAQSAASPLRDKFDHTLTGIGAVGIRQRVQQRLLWDRALAESAIEVVAADKDVELKGVVKRDEQRRRAIDLAETTAGVDRVIDRLQVE